MNSEVLQDHQSRKLQDILRQKETISLRESKIISEGNAAQSFVSQPFWKTVVSDLTETRDKFLADLKNPNKMQTKEQMRILQIRIADIELFLDSPTKYIETLRDLNRRKIKKI